MCTFPLPPVRLALRLPADSASVRDGLAKLLATAPLRDLSADLRGSVEIVLAEVFNNIVEHAYDRSTGCIDVALTFHQPTLWVEVTDTGRAMPSELLPDGDLADLDGCDDLPEGGFGWFLIRSLTRDLVYRRRSDRNMLAFSMDAA